MKLKEALIAMGLTSIVIMSINIIISSAILIWAWNCLLSNIHPVLPELSFFNAVGIMLVAYAIQGKLSLKISIK